MYICVCIIHSTCTINSLICFLSYLNSLFPTEDNNNSTILSNLSSLLSICLSTYRSIYLSVSDGRGVLPWRTWPFRIHYMRPLRSDLVYFLLVGLHISPLLSRIHQYYRGRERMHRRTNSILWIGEEKRRD